MLYSNVTCNNLAWSTPARRQEIFKYELHLNVRSFRSPVVFQKKWKCCNPTDLVSFLINYSWNLYIPLNAPQSDSLDSFSGRTDTQLGLKMMPIDYPPDWRHLHRLPWPLADVCFDPVIEPRTRLALSNLRQNPCWLFTISQSQIKTHTHRASKKQIFLYSHWGSSTQIFGEMWSHYNFCWTCSKQMWMYQLT